MNEKANLAASVSARLFNISRATGQNFETLLTTYCLERFLYRLGASDLSKRFILKGAMLLRLWSDQPYRATRDLDLLRRGDGAADAILEDLRAVVGLTVPPDAVEFEADSIVIEVIRAADDSVGTRAMIPVRVGKARVSLQIDMGIGDAVWPAPRTCTYPTLLGSPAPVMLAYPKEAVIAEKFEAMVVLGDRNSRIKDFFDLHYLASRFEFDRATLAEAVRRTFERRNTPLPAEDPIGLTPAYWENPSRPAQMRAFARRAGLDVPSKLSDDFTRLLNAFLAPVLNDVRDGKSSTAIWSPGGPWS